MVAPIIAANITAATTEDGSAKFSITNEEEQTGILFNVPSKPSESKVISLDFDPVSLDAWFNFAIS